MKKLLGIMTITALAVSAFAQGTVILANQTGTVKQWTSATDQTLISVPKGGGYVELFAAPVGTALANSFVTSVAGGVTLNYSSLAGFIAANPGWGTLPSNAAGAGTPALIGLGAGVFAGGTYTINGIPDGGNASYFLLGWTGSATTLDAAIASGSAFFGQSALATTATSSLVGTPSPPLPVNLRTTFAGMTLIPVATTVPEPSTFALAGLGAAALMIFRRRK